MAKEKNDNPLASLDLSGLRDLTVQTKAQPEAAQPEALLAREAGRMPTITPVAPAATLGLLAPLLGNTGQAAKWVGPGFNLIEIPNRNQAKPGPPPADKFRLILNSTSETINFTNIEGDIINRGNAQSDIAFRGLHYLQQVTDIILNEGIHLETGLFLNLPTGTDPDLSAADSVARLGSIPHGDSLLAQGRIFSVPNGPRFETADPTPFTLNPDGSRKNDTSPEYLALLNNAVPPAGIPKEVIMNPNILLENAIKGQTITETIVILLDANPIPGVCNEGAVPTVGGITNIPFVNVNANANSFTAIFWIEKVQQPDGTSSFTQLQYTQTVILDFPVFGADGKTVVDIKWPHISVATLQLQP
jgi:hypothetical protein